MTTQKNRDFLKKIKTSKRLLFKKYCEQLLDEDLTQIKTELRLEKKRSRRIRKKMNEKYDGLSVKVGGLRINYRMFKKVFDKVIGKQELKEMKKNVDPEAFRFLKMDFNAEKMRTQILEVFAPVKVLA